MQLIILVETKNKEGSDCKYLKSFFKKFYNGLRGTRLTIIPMHGKTNYDKKEKDIKRYAKQYTGESKVIITIDIDSPELSLDQKELNDNITKYCTEKGYELVWFNKTIEHVFIDEIVSKNKNDVADKFLRKQLIEKVDINRFSKDKPKNSKQKESNLKTIIDKLLENEINSN